MLLNLKIFAFKVKNFFKYFFSTNISRHTLFGRGVQILGLANVVIKDNCTIGDFTLITVNNRAANNIQCEIGRNTYIGRDNFFSVGKQIVISDYCIFGNKCSFICSDHIFDNPLIPYAKSGNSYQKAIRIGVNSWLGHNVSVIGNVTIGHGCVIGANTVITKNIPPFSMVVGNPARIIKTYNFDRQSWDKGEVQTPSIYLDESVYLAFLTKHFQNLSLGHFSVSYRYGHL